MLTALHIQDFVLIDSLRLSLGQGMTALTGETGAGKSILLEALGLATGGRAARGSVRAGADKGIVTAVYEPLADHAVWQLMEDNGIGAEDDQVILKRIQMADGKGRAFVNDQPVSVQLLKTIGASLLEIHGQHDGHGFLSAPTHRLLLDDFAGLAGDVAKLHGLWEAWRDLNAELDERRARRDQASREADYLRHVVDELASLAPQPGEEQSLAELRAERMAVEKISEDLVAAQSLLGDDGLESRLSACGRRLARAAATFEGGNSALSEALDRIERALSEIMEARSAVDDAVQKIGHDPDELERAEERLFALRAAARKHGVTPDGLPGFLAKAAGALDELQQGEAQFADLEAKIAKAAYAYFELAEKISSAREGAASRLDKAVMSELAPLKLGKAIFETRIETSREKPGADGLDRVEFMVATNPGAPAGPLKTIASGGELSRFVLAMKAALAARENRTVIIFDEVDAGVGGAVADAVGERLARLARDAQVLVVTHSPQVAARAQTHWLVEKTQSKSQTSTKVRALDNDERVEEIARMLSGAKVTNEARAAAASLLSPPASKKTRTAQKATTKKPAAPKARRQRAS